MQRKMLAALAALASMSIGACQTNQVSETSVAAPDAKSVVLANKGRLWKDPDSIKNASITAPRRHMGFMWHVCVSANAKNSFGGYTGEKDMLIGLYDDGKPPSVLMADARGYCDFPHEPFPELEGGYDPAAGRPKA